MHCFAVWFKLTAFGNPHFKRFRPAQTSRTLLPIRCCRRLVGRASRRFLSRQDGGSTPGFMWKAHFRFFECIETMNPSGSSDRFGVPPSDGSDRLKPGLQTFGSWRESMHHGWQTRQSPAPHFCFGSLARSHQFVRPSFHGSCRLNPSEIFRPFTSTLNFFVVQPDAGRA